MANEALHIHATRYTTRPFPTYRFIPGRFPHPVAHPEGHSYRAPGEIEPPAAFHSPDDWRQSEDYLYGCDLYNHGYWWEAHEAWEGLWHVVPNPSPQRSYLQGLIQVAAGHLQTYLGKAEGVRRLMASSRAHLEVALGEAGSDAYMGLMLHDWMDDVQRYWTSILAEAEISPRYAAYPYIRLARVDES